MTQQKTEDQIQNASSWIQELLTSYIEFEIYKSPHIILKSGYTFNKSTLERLPTSTCPLTRIPFIDSDIVVDISMRNILAYYQNPKVNAQVIPWPLLICPLSKQPFKNPVVAANGVTYEHAAIESYLLVNFNCLPNTRLIQNLPLISNFSFKNMINSKDYLNDLQWSFVQNNKIQKNNEWADAILFLNNKPDGSVLPYSAILDESTNLLQARSKTPTMFNEKKYKTTRSFIKIEDKIYRLLNNINNDKPCKFKYIEDEQGIHYIVKIETSSAVQSNEFNILNDLGIGLAKTVRQDKNKYYTVLPSMGIPLQKIMGYQLILCKQKPAEKDIRSNHAYFYLTRTAVHYIFRSHDDMIVEIPLSPKNSELLKKSFNIDLTEGLQKLAGKGFDYVLCKKRPEYHQIRYNIIYVYQNAGGLRYAYHEKNHRSHRKIINPNSKYYTTIQQAFTNTLDCPEELKPAIYNEIQLNPPLNSNERLKIAIEICLQVANLHEGLSSSTNTCYAHLDIKPQNIIINLEGNVSLIDYSMAEPYPKKIRTTESQLDNNYYLPFSRNFKKLTREQIDVLALKRTLFFPQSFVSGSGFYSVTKYTQNELSVLNQNILKQFKLEAYIDTYCTKNCLQDFTDDNISARELAAILITALLNLPIDYEEIRKNQKLLNLITSMYTVNKGKQNLKEKIVSAVNENLHNANLQANHSSESESFSNSISEESLYFRHGTPKEKIGGPLYLKRNNNEFFQEVNNANSSLSVTDSNLKPEQKFLIPYHDCRSKTVENIYDCYKIHGLDDQKYILAAVLEGGKRVALPLKGNEHKLFNSFENEIHTHLRATGEIGEKEAVHHYIYTLLTHCINKNLVAEEEHHSKLHQIAIGKFPYPGSSSDMIAN